jgi:hypothetical protein
MEPPSFPMVRDPVRKERVGVECGGLIADEAAENTKHLREQTLGMEYARTRCNPYCGALL